MHQVFTTSVWVAAIAFVVGSVEAQQTLESPRGEFIPYLLDSGPVANGGKDEKVAFARLVDIPDAGWIRLYFADVNLEEGSLVRITSLKDFEVQVLDAAGIAMWSNTTAYFNGNRLMVELIAGAGTVNNRLRIEQIAVEYDFSDSAMTLCGICTTDNRTASNVDYAGRLMPVGCSAAVYTPDSCLVSAGHCASGTSVIQFRVPPSLSNCALQHPSVNDQFPVTQAMSNNGGVGNDWAVMRTGNNGLGQSIVTRYGEFRPVTTSPPTFSSIEVFGFGSTKVCTTTQTQQRSAGGVTNIFSNAFGHNAVTTGGNSGAGVFFNNQVIGIVTHCSQPCPNIAQRMDLSTFAAARLQLCPPPAPANDNCVNALLRPVGTHAITTVNATTDGPTEPNLCNFLGFPDIQNDVWYKHIATCTGTLKVSLCGSSFNTKMAAYAGCPSASNQAIACNDDFCGLSSEISFPVVMNTVYQIRIGSANGATGTGTMTITCTPAPSCTGDTNNDLIVNVNDLLAVINSWGPCASPCPADVEPPGGNGSVNVNDLLTVINAWGPCP